MCTSALSRAIVSVCLFLAALFPTCSAASSEPRTLYKPQDIRNARENVTRYRWAQDIVEGWKQAVAVAMEQDREFFEQMIPEVTPGTHYGQHCPACVHPVLRRGARNLQWTVTDPDRLSCGQCGMIYPHDEYPETGVLELPRMGQTLTYYQTPDERVLPAEATAEERAKHALLGTSNLPTMIIGTI